MKSRILSILFFLLSDMPLGHGDQLTLISQYPAPSGHYQEISTTQGIQIEPSNSQPACDPDKAGTFYSDTNGNLWYCNGQRFQRAKIFQEGWQNKDCQTIVAAATRDPSYPDAIINSFNTPIPSSTVYAQCPAGTWLASGSASCYIKPESGGLHPGFVTRSEPFINGTEINGITINGQGWIADCFEENDNTKSCARAIAVCCHP